jgi:CubicO group peptidase (beta-lactamase class C family)
MSATDPGPLAAVDRWGAGVAAAAAIGSDGAVHRHGDTTAVLRIASITKLVAAWAVLVAVEEGALGLTDPLGPPGSTVRHVLCHASGLDFDTDRVVAPAGTRRIYSNTGYDLLAEHLSSCTGMDVGQYLDEAVLSPLAMTSSELRGSIAKDLWSNVEDLLRFTDEMVRPSLLHPDTVVDALSPQFPELAGVLPGWGPQHPCPWGLGPELRGAKSPHWTGATASPRTYGHFGGSGTLLWVDPDAHVRCVALSDREFGDWALEAWPPFSDAVRAGYA